MIITCYWRKPIPTDAYDWTAHFDGDEPDDNGNMLVGHGSTEMSAKYDLIELWEHTTDRVFGGTR